MTRSTKRPQPQKVYDDIFLEIADTPEMREEISEMQKSIADFLKDEGKREALLLLLRERFKTVPVEIETKVLDSRNTQQIEAWLIAVLRAKKLKDIDFGLTK